MAKEQSRFQRKAQDALYMEGARRLQWKVDHLKPEDVRMKGAKSYARDLGFTALGVAAGLSVMTLALTSAENTPSGQYQKNRYEEGKKSEKQAEADAENRQATSEYLENANPQDVRMQVQGAVNPDLQLKAGRGQDGKLFLYPNPNSDPSAAQPPVDSPNVEVK